MVHKANLILVLILLFSLCGCRANNSAGLTQSNQETDCDNTTTGTQYDQSANIDSSAEEQNSKPESFGTDTATTATGQTDEYGQPIFDPAANQGYKGNFPLYAMLKSENIYLYGVYPYGMVLYQNGNGTYFDWPGLTPRCILPELSYLDYNGDGKKELAVILYCGSGTSVSEMDLHILEINQLDNKRGKPTYTDHALLSGDVKKWFTKPITATPLDSDKTFSVIFDGQEYHVVYDYSDQSTYGKFTGITYGNIVEFKFDKSKIKTDIAIGFTFEKCAEPIYFGSVEATVDFKNNQFSLSDYTFIV